MNIPVYFINYLAGRGKRLFKSYGLIVLMPLVLMVSMLSCEDVLEKDLNDQKIVLIAPTDSVVTADTLQKFAWDHIQPIADYQLQIVSPSFDSIATLYIDTVTADNLVQVKLNQGKQYQWRVRAINGSYSSPYCRPWTLTIQ